MSQVEAKSQPPPGRGATLAWPQATWPVCWPHQVKRRSTALSRQRRLTWVRPSAETFCSQSPGARAAAPEVGGAVGEAGGLGAPEGLLWQAQSAASAAAATRTLRMRAISHGE